MNPRTIQQIVFLSKQAKNPAVPPPIFARDLGIISSLFGSKTPFGKSPQAADLSEKAGAVPTLAAGRWGAGGSDNLPREDGAGGFGGTWWCRSAGFNDGFPNVFF